MSITWLKLLSSFPFFVRKLPGASYDWLWFTILKSEFSPSSVIKDVSLNDSSFL